MLRPSITHGLIFVSPFFLPLKEIAKTAEMIRETNYCSSIVEGARGLFRIRDSSEERILRMRARERERNRERKRERERDRPKPRGLFCCLVPAPSAGFLIETKRAEEQSFPGEKRAIALYMLIVVQSELYNSQPSPCR